MLPVLVGANCRPPLAPAEARPVASTPVFRVPEAMSSPTGPENDPVDPLKFVGPPSYVLSGETGRKNLAEMLSLPPDAARNRIPALARAVPATKI